jgi:ABC-type amino acid transport system permease subunit
LYRIAVIYVGIFRGLPETVLIFWIYYCGPLVLNVRLSEFGSGLLALSLVAGAYLCEIFRAGVQAVPKSQLEAAHALSLPASTIGLSIIVPQAFQTMLPTLIGLLTIMLKNSAILSAIGTAELFYEAYTIAAVNYKYFELITAAGIIYFMIIFPLSMISQSAERKLISKKR